MKRKPRPLGDYTDKAWLTGWDYCIMNRPVNHNPYKRRPQREAFVRGHKACENNAVNSLRTVMRRQYPNRLIA
jgi:hypothetical protein